MSPWPSSPPLLFRLILTIRITIITLLQLLTLELRGGKTVLHITTLVNSQNLHQTQVFKLTPPCFSQYAVLPFMVAPFLGTSTLCFYCSRFKEHSEP